MKNYFKLKSATKELVAFNEMYRAFSYWSQRFAYAKYITISGGGHSLTKLASVVSYNDNVARGALYATYKIDILLSEFPYPIQEIGFSPYKGAQPSNRVKVYAEPESMTIYGTVYLESNVRDFCFYPGENHLVRSLLGMEEAGKMEVRGGASTLDAPGLINESGYTEIEASSYMNDGLEVSFDAGGFTHFLLWDGAPCAMFNLGTFAAETKNKVASAQGGFFAEDAVSVESVNGLDGTFTAYPVISELFASGAEEKDGFEGYKLLSDPAYRYAVVANGKRFYFINEDFSLEDGGFYDGEISLCYNGVAAIVGGGKITFVPGGRSFEIIDGETVALFSGGGYDVFVHSEDRLFIYRIEEALSLVKTIEGVSGKLSRANDYMVIVQNGNEKRLFTKDGEQTYNFDSFTFIKDETIADGCYYGDGYMGSFLSYSRVIVSASKGRLAISENNLVYVGEGGIKTLLTGFDFDDAAIARSAVIFLKAGKLSFYRAGFKGVFVSAPVFGLTEYTERERALGNGFVTLRITQ